MIPFAASIAAYEGWMRERLGEALMAGELARKHRRMRDHPFLFLRATCWRYAEAAPLLLPGLMSAPAAPSVGDAHAGNFGLWRDAEARLVWGANDFDEAARIPWPLDLVRLGASLLLAGARPGADEIAEAMLQGYGEGLANPRPFVLERNHLWLRDAFATSDKHREEFWRELEQAEPATAPPSLHAAMIAALPDPATPVTVAARSAGAGSLGRPRYVAHGEYRGGPVAVEVKGVLPSCYAYGREPGLAARLVHGANRSPDPSFRYRETYVTKRLAPNSRKLDFEEADAKLHQRLIRAMGAELAAIHAEAPELAEAIGGDLRRRRDGWLADAARHIAEWTIAEQKAYRAG